MTKQVCEIAHAIGVSVEGELGCLGSLEIGDAGEEDGSGAEGKLTHDLLLTDPEQAQDFVAQTGVDALAIAIAIAIGTNHGAYKFSRQPTGDIEESYGLPVEEIQRGIRSGVRKVNIDTDIRLVMTGAMRKTFAEQPANSIRARR